ncbi:MAG: hypothetical protein IIA03_10775 [Proteobacteria bacterium]|nr:hypothetical protein [Methylibium sp.]MCH8856699.1 hypothetical protein [Pseudomonadota bacterium]
MGSLKRITIYVDHVDSAGDFDSVRAWLSKWEGQVRVHDYSTGGWEHTWDVEAPAEAVAELPEGWLCASAWSTPEIFGVSAAPVTSLKG